jgi:apolipoprotein N-acyltransferase
LRRILRWSHKNSAWRLLSFSVRQIHWSAWLLVLLSAVLAILIFPLPGLSILSWFALAPLIVALVRARPAGELEIAGSRRLEAATPRQGFVLGYTSGMVWYAGTCYWIFDTMRLYGGLNAPMALLVLCLFCGYLGLYHGLFGLVVGLLARRRDDRWALVLAPFVWVTVELARTRITGFPWNLLGTAEVDNLALCRLGQWTGVYGISFEIMVVNVALAAAFLLPRRRRGAMLVASLAAAAALQAGRLVEPPPANPDHKALLVQENVPVSVDWTPAYFEQTLTELTELSESSVARTSAVANDRGSQSAGGVPLDLIVWPESPAPFFTNDARFRQAISEMAEHTGVPLVVGAIGSNPPNRDEEVSLFNSAALVNRRGDWVSRYDKIHLVPFGEYLPFPSLFSFAGGLTREVGRFERGTSRRPLDTEGESLGVFICYESVFPDEVRQFAGNGAQVFVNISNDGWYGDSGAYAQHLNQTRMRAIENDRWILSATDTGVTASIDPSGRIAVRAPRKQRTALVAPYALSSATTFYARHGDWFACACAIISVGALVARSFSKRNQKAETSA